MRLRGGQTNRSRGQIFSCEEVVDGRQGRRTTGRVLAEFITAGEAARRLGAKLRFWTNGGKGRAQSSEHKRQHRRTKLTETRAKRTQHPRKEATPTRRQRRQRRQGPNLDYRRGGLYYGETLKQLIIAEY